MSRIIAETYEIIREIGSGGSGVVYLAKHLRLDKMVVLKADKRSITAKPDALRREVDSLKGLSHTNIPQVYDYIVEQDTVYTVMDYIEGESLDKPLKRGVRFPQSQVVGWACQLLEALCYLHSRPPHGILHSDIKPANIMVTPQNEIRLIDFNIALALGEEGAVRVGFSSGYASPEHYGIDYSTANITQGDSAVLTQIPHTSAATFVDSQGSGASSSTQKRSILLDVRSDIYSLGATLYHLLSGTRPPPDAKQVVPLASSAVSPAIAAIISKSMAPDPACRYQTAQEMLDAFLHLHENDPRTKKLRKQTSVVTAVLAMLLLAGAACTFIGLRWMERDQARDAEAARMAEEAARAAEEAERVEKQALSLATRAEDAYRKGDIPSAIQLACDAMDLDTVYTAQAQKVLTDALGVYDLSDGYKSNMLLELPSEPLKVELSPAGTRLAAMVSGTLFVFDTIGGDCLAELPAEPSAWADMVFVNEDNILYAGIDALCSYEIPAARENWTGAPATEIVVSGDGLRAAAVDRSENLATVYDTLTGTILKVVTFQNQRQTVAANDVFIDPENDIFSLNSDGTMLAVSFDDGALEIFDLSDNGEDMTIFPSSDFTHFEGGFFEEYFAFSAKGDGQSIFAIIDTQEQVQTGGFSSSKASYHAKTTSDGIYISSENILVRIHPVTGEQEEVAYTEADIISFEISAPYVMVACPGGAYSFFDSNAILLENHSIDGNCDFARVVGGVAVVASSDSPYLHVLRLETHADAQVFSYDREYSHLETRLSQDESTIMLYRYDRFRLYSLNGDILAETSIPDSEQVYDQQYHKDADGSSLEVIYNDGTIRKYSAQDGTLIAEESGDAPDRSLYEEFQTDDFRIERPLHGTPTVYDKVTGEMVGTLESDAYLTYVTQVGEHIVTEYMTTQGERYGLLLNESLEILARLPNLCDITPDGRLLFDDMKGNLRYSRIYSTQELYALAK